MGVVRYGARPPEQVRNREVEATTTPIWSRAVTVVFETDPEAIAAVLPRPLEPSVPTARLRIAVVDMGTGLQPFGAGWFGVRARHGETEGEYALFMPMTTEQATIGGRETFGEPKKIAEVGLSVEGDTLTARIGRMGSTVAEVSGTLGAESHGYEIDKLDFYFKLLPDPSGTGLRLLPPARGGPDGPSGERGVQADGRPPRPHRRLPGAPRGVVRLRRDRLVPAW